MGWTCWFLCNWSSCHSRSSRGEFRLDGGEQLLLVRWFLRRQTFFSAVLSLSSKSWRRIFSVGYVIGNSKFLRPVGPFHIASNSGVKPCRDRPRSLWLVKTLLYLQESRRISQLWKTVYQHSCPVNLQYCSHRLSCCLWYIQWVRQGCVFWNKCSYAIPNWTMHRTMRSKSLKKLSMKDDP